MALIFAVQKLRHYMLSHKITLISKIDPLKFLMTRPAVTGRLARWAVLLLQFDITAWTYAEMPGLSPDVAIHKLAIKPDVAPVKQAPRRMRLEIEEQVIAETKKFIEAGFIREEKYADWIANIVPMKKKNG